MLSEKLHEALNDQVNYEFYSAHFYLSMAAYCESIDLKGFAHYFVIQDTEERFHAMKMYAFLNNMDGKVTLSGIKAPRTDYDSVLDVFETAIGHEQSVTKRLYHLMDIAMEEREHATISFLKWFIDEQVEEEASMKEILKKLRRISKDEHGLYMMDQEMSQRVFVPPVN